MRVSMHQSDEKRKTKKNVDNVNCFDKKSFLKQMVTNIKTINFMVIQNNNKKKIFIYFILFFSLFFYVYRLIDKFLYYYFINHVYVCHIMYFIIKLMLMCRNDIQYFIIFTNHIWLKS